jgi:hypothetical protein
MAGYPLTALDINNKAGLVARAVWEALNDAHDFSLWLADSTHDDTTLGPSGVGVTSADLTVIRASITDLGSVNGLWGVAHAQKTVTSTNDFFFNAKKLGGIYFTG